MWSDVRVRAALLARPETPVADAVSAARARGGELLRALACERGAGPVLLEELAALPGAARHVLGRGDAPDAARCRALCTLDAVLRTPRGWQRRRLIVDAVRRALREAPIAPAALGAVAAAVSCEVLLGELARRALPARAQRRIAEICVDEVLRDCGVRTSQTADGNRRWAAEVTLALAGQDGCAVRERLARSWDRRGPHRGTQLDVLPERTSAQVRAATWGPARLEWTLLTDVTQWAASDRATASALLARFTAACGEDAGRWEAAVQIAGAAHGTVGDALLALAAVTA